MELDPGAAYRIARLSISDLVSDDVVDVAVPATPAWNVHDVVAHVTGVAADGTSGNMAGAPGEAWTAAQVARGQGRSIAEMIDEWSQTGPLMESFLSSPTGAMAAAAVMDIHTHDQDLRHALGRPQEVQADVLAWAVARLRTGWADQCAAAGLAPAGVGGSDIEWFRARFGRRTTDEVVAMGWSIDGRHLDPSEIEPYLEHFFIFGRATTSLGETVISNGR